MRHREVLEIAILSASEQSFASGPECVSQETKHKKAKKLKNLKKHIQENILNKTNDIYITKMLIYCNFL